MNESIKTRIFYQLGDNDLLGILCPIEIPAGTTVQRLRKDIGASTIGVYRGRVLEENLEITPDISAEGDLQAKYITEIGISRFRDVIDNYNQKNKLPEVIVAHTG